MTEYIYTVYESPTGAVIREGICTDEDKWEIQEEWLHEPFVEIDFRPTFLTVSPLPERCPCGGTTCDGSCETNTQRAPIQFDTGPDEMPF